MLQLPHYKPRYASETKGYEYSVGDFAVRIASTSVKEKALGVLVEVEYRPLKRVGEAGAVLGAFAQMLQKATEMRDEAGVCVGRLERVPV